MAVKKAPREKAPSSKIYEKVAKYGEELKALIKARHPEAQFGEPWYWAEEGVWLIDVYTYSDDTFEIGDLVHDRETDILLQEGICLYVIPLLQERADIA